MLKAEAVKEGDARPFELVCMGKNLIGSLEVGIGSAGLRNGTVMVEFLEGEE